MDDRNRNRGNPLRLAWWALRRNPTRVIATIRQAARDRRFIRECGLFDEAWYLRRYRDVANAGLDPLDHYIAFSVSQSRDPNAFFDTSWYLNQYPELRTSGVNPLVHFLTVGAAEGSVPSPLLVAPPARIGSAAAADSTVDGLRATLGQGRESGAEASAQPNANGSLPWPIPREPTALWGTPGWTYLAQEFGIPVAGQVVSLLAELRLTAFDDDATGEPEEWELARWSHEISRLADQAEDAPLVSIVLPVHNQLRYSLACLASLLYWPTRASFEVIVANDASTDATAKLLAELPYPVRLVNRQRNLGFLRNCNRAAETARGKYILFLNNDTFVLPNWLDELVDTLEREPRAGLVGSKLLYADAELQEAGGLIWEDASGANIGRGPETRAPWFNFSREVDYCSGASILLPRSLWWELGGFDERYAPAYYEDTDLAFRVREAGYRVLYQPLSQLIHFEGKSHGTDVASGVKRHQEINRQVFLERWGERLRDHRRPTPSDPYCYGRYARDRVLFVDACTPTPDQDSGSVDAFNILRMLKRLGFHVTFCSTTDLGYQGRYTRDLQRVGIECLYFPYVLELTDWLAQYGGGLSLVILTRMTVAAEYHDAIREHCPKAKILFNTVDLHFLRLQREAALTGDQSTLEQAEQAREMELDLIRRSDATLVVGEQEKRLLQDLVPRSAVYWLPLPREIPPRSVASAASRDVVFIGGFQHPPNVDAIEYFASEIWPLVHSQAPDSRFLIVGSRMPDDISRFDGQDGIRVLGFVPDLEPVFARTRLSVAPLRFGAGQKGKVVTSLSFGVPVVATSVAAEGMTLTDGEQVLIADTPAAFADAVLRLLTRDDLWSHLSESGRVLVSEIFGFENVARGLRQILADLGVQRCEGISHD